jgi:hypothetical protein
VSQPKAQRRAAAILLCAIAAAPVDIAGQDTREGIVAAEQAAKAARIAADAAAAAAAPARPPSTLRRAIDFGAKGMLDEPPGFFPFFESAYSGGGFTLGAGYRRFTGDRTNWAVIGLYSIRNYKRFEASLSSPGHAAGRLDVRGLAGWRDATQVRYNGLGIDSPPGKDVAFRMQQAYAGAELTVKPGRRFVVKTGAILEDFTLKDPMGGLIPLEDVHTAVTAPGLGVSPTYLHFGTSAAIDSRPAADYARRGGLYEISHHRYVDTGGTYGFDRLGARVVQHIPILRETWVISLRGQLQTSVDADDQVPYFLMPALGGGNTLRGYNTFRFRDRHSALASGEFRWIVNRMAFDMALFYDTGMVASRIDQLALRDFVSNVGVGARLHTPASTPLRVEVAWGGEGVHLIFGGSAAF